MSTLLKRLMMIALGLAVGSCGSTGGESRLSTLAGPAQRWERGSDGREWMLACNWRDAAPQTQRQQKDCAVCSLDILTRYLERYYRTCWNTELLLPTYEETAFGLTESDYAADHNWQGFVSLDTVAWYWSAECAPRAMGWTLRRYQATSIEELIEAVATSQKPVLVSYVMPYGASDCLNVLRVLAFVPSLGLSEALYKAKLPFGLDDEVVLDGYLHASVCIGFSRKIGSDDDLRVHLVDPWTGQRVAWSASDFAESWLKHDRAGNSRFARSIAIPQFRRLASPGSYMTLENGRP